MKVFAIQKAQVNTGASQFNQNGSGNQNSAMKTNIIGDKFVSKNVSFSGGKSIRMLENELAELNKKLELGKLTEEAYEKLARPIREEIYDLSCKAGLIETGSDYTPGAQTWW